MSWETIEYEGQTYRVAVVRTTQGVWLGWRGGSVCVKQQGRRATGQPADGVDAIAAPMTGKVLDVLVAPGDSVEAGQVLVILEAMKMEYRLKAPAEGVVETVCCAPGELVDQGATLATLDET